MKQCWTWTFVKVFIIVNLYLRDHATTMALSVLRQSLHPECTLNVGSCPV